MRTVLVRVQPPQPNFSHPYVPAFLTIHSSDSESEAKPACKAGVLAFCTPAVKTFWLSCRNRRHMLPPVGMVHWVWFLGKAAEASRREDRAGPALNPLKGSSARLPSYGLNVCTSQAKHKSLKTQCFHSRTPGKKSHAAGNFSERNFARTGNTAGAWRRTIHARGKNFSHAQHFANNRRESRRKSQDFRTS
jgi:hypothetical protein